MPSTLDVLNWAAMTAAVNEMKSPNTFLQDLLFSDHHTNFVEDIEISTILKAREIAPFVRKNGEGIMVAGHSERFATVTGPNIRIKRPITPSELLYNRRPGTVIFVSGDQQISAIQQHIARDLQVMADLVTNAQEWLCSQALQGTIAYSVADGDVFTITYPKPIGNNPTLSIFWDDATPANVNVLANNHVAKKIMSDEVGLAPTDAICGSEASAALRKLIADGNVKSFVNNNGQVKIGSIDFTTQYSDQGVIYIGEISGIRFWEYSRTASLNGTAVSMIRPKFVEFVSTSSASQRVMEYAAIPDLEAFEGRLFQAERFSKTWMEPDPSVRMALLHSRPLPVTRRPGATVSMKVVSGS